MNKHYGPIFDIRTNLNVTERDNGDYKGKHRFNNKKRWRYANRFVKMNYAPYQVWFRVFMTEDRMEENV